MIKFKVYPLHDDYGEYAKALEKVINGHYKNNKSVIDEMVRIELREMEIYPHEKPD